MRRAHHAGDRETGASSAPTQPPTLRAVDERILLVEDDPSIREVAAFEDLPPGAVEALRREENMGPLFNAFPTHLVDYRLTRKISRRVP